MIRLAINLHRNDRDRPPAARQRYLITIMTFADGSSHSSHVSPQEATLDWQAMKAHLKRLCPPEPSPTLLQQIGDQLREFLGKAGWNRHEQDIRKAAADGQPVDITVVSNDDEVYLLPWELLTLAGSGGRVEASERVVIGYALPDGRHHVEPASSAMARPTRALFAWSDAGGDVPFRPHREALDAAFGERAVTEIEHVTLSKLDTAFAPGFHHFEPAQIAEARILRIHGGTDDLCRALYHRPEAILPLLALDDLQRPMISPEAQSDLGRAALRHPIVRDALFAAWDKNPDRRLINSVYPGNALLPLVFREDQQAITRYAAWLPGSLYMSPFHRVARPDPRIFTIPEICAAAHKNASRVWHEASVGYDRDGRHMHLAASTMSSILHYFQPAWLSDNDLTAELSEWLVDPDMERRSAACWAFAGGPLPPQLCARVEEVIEGSIREYMENPDFTMPIERLLRTVECLDLQSMSPLLTELTRMPVNVSARAAAILIPSLDSQATRELSMTMALRGWLPGDHVLENHHIARLVDAAPAAWCALAVTVLDHAGIGGIPLAMRLLPHLPDDYVNAVVQAIYRQAHQLDLPWLSITGFSGAIRFSRPDDLVSRVLYDAGVIPAEEPAEADRAEDEAESRL